MRPLPRSRPTGDPAALIIPDIENPFFTALARGVEDRARAAGYSVVLCNTDDDTARESTYIDIALAEHMAGVILAPADENSDVAELLALPEPPDAAFVANNLMAVGALQALREAGLAPPEFGLAAFGDLPYGWLARDGVRVVPLPARELGAAAADLLLDRIAGADTPPRTVVLRTGDEPMITIAERARS